MEPNSGTTMILSSSPASEEHKWNPDLDTNEQKVIRSSAKQETPSVSGDFDDISMRELRLKNIELRQQITELQSQLKKMDDLHAKRNKAIQFYKKVFAYKKESLTDLDRLTL